MSPLLRKALLLGLGIASISQQKINKYVENLKKKKNLNDREGRKLARDLLKKSRVIEKEFARIAVKNINHFLKSNKCISKKDIELLRKLISKRRNGKRKKKKR